MYGLLTMIAESVSVWRKLNFESRNAVEWLLKFMNYIDGSRRMHITANQVSTGVYRGLRIQVGGNGTLKCGSAEVNSEAFWRYQWYSGDSLN